MSETLCARKNEALVDAALHYAKMGLPVFPCEPNGKRPISNLAPHGCNSATTDSATILCWWRQCPTANIGLVAGENFLILDVDCKDGKDGYGDLAAMEAALGKLPVTVTAKTPSGGSHYFFKKPDAKIKSATKIKWQGKPTSLDLRFGNAYVLAAPSTIDGKPYKFENPLERNADKSLNIAALPDKWVAALPRHETTSASAKPATPFVPYPVRSFDERNAVERCARYVATMDSCVARNGGDTQLYRVCCTIFHDFALQGSEGMRILEAFNARCQPPWSEYRLLYKVKEAMRSDNKDKPRGWRLERGQA